jgi:hypothetical protein
VTFGGCINFVKDPNQELPVKSADRLLLLSLRFECLLTEMRERVGQWGAGNFDYAAEWLVHLQDQED